MLEFDAHQRYYLFEIMTLIHPDSNYFLNIISNKILDYIGGTKGKKDFDLEFGRPLWDTLRQCDRLSTN